MSIKDYVPDGGFIETAGGRYFVIDEPEFYIDDIAHALAMKVRYGGHCRRFYSVAEHSVLVSLICEGEGLADPLEGLLHDAVEAYIGDMPSPIKHVLPDFKALEHRLERQLREQFGLPPEMTPGCKRADLLALYLEAQTLLPSGGAVLFPQDTDGLREAVCELDPSYTPVCMSPKMAQNAFIGKFREVSK